MAQLAAQQLARLLQQQQEGRSVSEHCRDKAGDWVLACLQVSPHSDIRTPWESAGFVWAQSCKHVQEIVQLQSVATRDARGGVFP